eukprot:TRINITY_DN2760_c0_g2_i1.p1 TRINITY_DN2760_c0_g2~~TRINITY_DN2760_c0_g2_i1.p1  ORF type:complete len:379 (+),score=101.79 TRINITY_DN2760_c0_g2_i1:48-1184(+)
MADMINVMLDNSGDKLCVSVPADAYVRALRAAVAAEENLQDLTFDLLMEGDDGLTPLDDADRLSDILTDEEVVIRVKDQALAEQILADENILRQDYSYVMTSNSASPNGSVSKIEMILRAGADPNAGAKHGQEWAPLSKAAYHGNCGAAKVLLQYGANVDHLDHGGWAPLHHAADFGAPDIVELLLDNNAEINRLDNKQKTAAHWAAHRGNSTCMRILLDRGTSVVHRDWLGRTPLHWALLYNQEHCSMELIAVGAPLGVASNDGRTPLMCAIQTDSGTPSAEGVLEALAHEKVDVGDGVMKDHLSMTVEAIKKGTPSHEPSAARAAVFLLDHGMDPFNGASKALLAVTKPSGTPISNDRATAVKQMRKMLAPLCVSD